MLEWSHKGHIKWMKILSEARKQVYAEEFYFQGYNAVYSIKNQATFHKNMSPQSSCRRINEATSQS
jgi:hypothetical protein